MIKAKATIIVIFNQEKYIEETINSLLNQKLLLITQFYFL